MRLGGRRNAHIPSTAPNACSNDATYINKTRLRASRIGKLRGLQDDLGGVELPLIPDGVADAEEDDPDMHPSAAKARRLLGPSADDTGTPTEVAPSIEPPIMLNRPRSCYICKRRFRRLVSLSMIEVCLTMDCYLPNSINAQHNFYDQMCVKSSWPATAQQ